MGELPQGSTICSIPNLNLALIMSWLCNICKDCCQRGFIHKTNTTSVTHFKLYSLSNDTIVSCPLSNNNVMQEHELIEFFCTLNFSSIAD